MRQKKYDAALYKCRFCRREFLVKIKKGADAPMVENDPECVLKASVEVLGVADLIGFATWPEGTKNE